jgi:cytochrome c oxidase subunit 1
MPRRYYDYPERFQALHVISTVGAWLLGVAMMLTLAYLVVALFRGERVSRNPWGARSFEWRSESPPPVHNFEGTPSFDVGPYDYDAPDGDADV